MAMELWTSPTPNGWKVTIMLEELKEAGVALPEVKLVPVDLMQKRQQLSEAFTEVSPNQKIPCLRDGCDENLDFEAGAGCLYAKFEDEFELAKNTDKLLDHLNVLVGCAIGAWLEAV